MSSLASRAFSPEGVDVALEWHWAAPSMTEPHELERQLETAYRAIEEIDEDLRAGRISTTDHAVSRKRAEAHAAQLLTRVREGSATETDRSSTSRSPRPRARTVVAGTVVIAFLAGVGVGVVVGRATAPAPAALVTGPLGVPRVGPAPGVVSPSAIDAGARDEPSGGPVVTGPAGGGRPPGAPGTLAGGAEGRPASPPHSAPAGPPPGLAAPPAAPSPKLQALDREASAENASIKTMLAFARLALEEKHRAPALSAYKRVLERDLRNADAIAGIGIILHDGQFIDQALARFDEALAIDPKLARAHWHRAQILFEAKRDYAEAVRAGEAFLALAPRGPDSDRARGLVAEARQRATAPAPPKSVIGEATR